jgi:histidinol-phosphate/aromatic aminotransferase/cobyric acid decarboxylase-like protein
LDVLPSQTNFILTRPPQFAAKAWPVRKQKFSCAGFLSSKDYLRITIGAETEVNALVRAVRHLEVQVKQAPE